jgi:tetratricopeptide (TPR) repeat protein
MDDPRLRDLLERAGREYNEGKYAEAIAHWQEALQIDPGSQKAREGIRMAQLLVVNWEAPAGEGGEAELSIAGSADSETQEKIEIGIGRVRELLGAGRYQEALEGCQLLAELAPGMDSVKHLLEEVTQIYEARPFIAERLERARKHLAQGRSREAAEEARNVLSVDRGNQEAQAILARAGGAPPEPRTKAPSAFQVEKAGKVPPPSPFAGRSEADALLAQFDYEASPAPPGAARPETPGAAAPAAAAADEPLDLLVDAGAAGAARRAPAGEDAQASVRSLLEEGRRHLSQKRYQEAIETCSRVFALDEANAEAGELIDKAKEALEAEARRAEEAFYRGVDHFDAGRLDEARHAFEEVLGIQQDHADARSYLDQIAEKTRASAKGAAAAAGPAAQASAGGGRDLDSSSVPLAAPSPRSATPPPAKKEPAVASLPPKRKPIVPVARSGRGRSLAIAGAAAVVVLGGGGYLLFTMIGGQGPSAEPVPAVAAASVPPPSPLETESGAAPSAAAPGAAPGSPGGMEVVPGAPAAPPSPPPPPDPAAVRRRIEALMREGRSLMKEEKFVEAASRFAQVTALDPANFDAEELRSEAAAAAQKHARFNRELEAAKAAFADQDWAGSLYKLYRLREEREDRTDLVRYIKNANYNWGIEALNQFETEAAVEHFRDALEMAPGDPVIRRHIEVATRYRRRQRDTAYDAYLRNLAPKGLEDR